MKSFDVFDTLIARRHINNDFILNNIQDKCYISNFVESRKQADTGTRSLSEIYDVLCQTGVIALSAHDEIMQMEIDLEIADSFPIQCNMDLVEHGDILISDMYMPASAIMQMVRHCGLTKQVTLYQSNGDKSVGTVWPKFQTVPTVHIGDNQLSDYARPTKCGINAALYQGSKSSASENFIMNAGLPNLSLMIREIRLRQSISNNCFSTLSMDYNLPLLLVIAEMIYRRNAKRNIVFLGRDCQLLHSIYTSFYTTAYYLPFSRKVAFSDPESAISYLKVHSPANPLYFDISSTGATWEKLQADIDILVAIYSDRSYYTKNKPTLPLHFNWLATNSQIGQTNITLEIMNCADHGYISNIQVHSDKLMEATFAEPELPAEIVQFIHTPIKQAVALSALYKLNVRHELAMLSNVNLIDLFAELSGIICATQFPQLAHFMQQESNYLGQFTK